MRRADDFLKYRLLNKTESCYRQVSKEKTMPGISLIKTGYNAVL
jgi:hypothetical protein